MMKHDSFDPFYMYDIEKLMRDTGTKFVPDVYGKIVGDYPPGKLCGLMLDIAQRVILQHPGMTRDECENALLKMEHDHEYCIAVNGNFGLHNYRPFNRFELQFSGALIKKGRQRGIALLDVCKETIGFGVQLIQEASTPKGCADFRSFKQITGHIFFHLAGKSNSVPNGLLDKLVILVEEVGGCVKCAFGEKRGDISVYYPIVKR